MSNIETLSTPVLTVIDGKPTTTSRQIADRFNKRHERVLHAIQNLNCTDDFRKHNFVSASYDALQPNGGKAIYKEYTLTRDGFTMLCMGFTGAKAAVWKERYIAAFNEMEAALTTNPPAPLPPTLTPEQVQAELIRKLERSRFGITLSASGAVQLYAIDPHAYNLPASKWAGVIATPGELAVSDVLAIAGACNQYFANMAQANLPALRHTSRPQA